MYHSQLQTVHPAGSRVMRYQGTLGSVLDEMAYVMRRAADCGELQGADVETIVLHPARIVRGTVDYNIAHGGTAEECVMRSLDFAVRMAGGRFHPREIDRLRGIIEGYAGALDTPVEEPEDCVTWACSEPRLSYATAARIHRSALRKGRRVLLVLSAHGSVRAGIDVFNSYQEIAGGKDAIALDIIRLSRYKRNETAPFLSADAKQRIRKAGWGKAVVVFDENLWTGTTALNLMRTIGSDVFSRKQVYAEGNWKNETLAQLDPDGYP